MARRVFFSFHYERDIWRVNQVRNSQVFKSRYAPQQFLDKADWESLKRTGKQAVYNWIDEQMRGAGVLAVLIGNETYSRPFVKYEIEQAYYKKMGIVGIYIHNIKNNKGFTDNEGINPFEEVSVIYRSSTEPLLKVINYEIGLFDWDIDYGYENIGSWIEKAAQNAGR